MCQVLRSSVYPLACKDLLQSRARNHPYKCLAILKVCWEPGLWMNHLTTFPINILKPTWVKCSYLVFRLAAWTGQESIKAELKINDLDFFQRENGRDQLFEITLFFFPVFGGLEFYFNHSVLLWGLSQLM